MIDLTRGCSRHRPVLIDFVDRGEVRPETGAALAHLDRCTTCTEIVETTMLTITALRRMGDDVATAEPPADSWPRLRIRIEGWRRRPVVMSPLAGVAMSFAIVAVLVLPIRVGGAPVGPSASPLGDAHVVTSIVDRRIEDAYIASVKQGTLPPADTHTETARGSANYPRLYPDNYRPIRKEVGPAEPSGRPPEAI